MIITAPMPFRQALTSREVRSLLPTTGNSAALAQLERDILERAVFSATVDRAERLQRIEDAVNASLTGQADTATLRLGLKQALAAEGYEPDPEKQGTIEDLSSTRRINLQIETNVALARGYGYWSQGQQADVLDEWPAQELFRATAAEKPRDWEKRWTDAGGELFEGRMIALKNDPIWTHLSRFGQPYPPFDFNSGMDVRDVARDEAVALGLIDADTQLFPQDRGFNDELELSPDVRSEALKTALEETGLGRFNAAGVFVFNGGDA
jgi:hypothetical protein